MSQDTIAILDVATPLDPATLLAQLAVEPALAALVPRFGAKWRPTRWTVEPSRTDPKGFSLVGPGGVVVRLGRRSAEVYHLLPFHSFAADDDERALVRRAVRAVARLVGSSRAIYTHELAPADRDPEAGADTALANLIVNVGPPAPSFAELAEPYRPGSWTLDTFADLDAN